MIKHIETWPIKVGIITLLITIFPWQYGIYMVGKVIIFIISIYYCYCNYKKESKNKYFWFFLFAAIIYNPILPVYLFYRTIWIIVDIILIIIFIRYYGYSKNYIHSKVSEEVYCKECGHKNKLNYNYCSHCGRKDNH